VRERLATLHGDAPRWNSAAATRRTRHARDGAPADARHSPHDHRLIAEDEPLLAATCSDELARLWPELRVVATVGDGEAAVQQALALRPTCCSSTSACRA
jgi:hypothetical protein